MPMETLQKRYRYRKKYRGKKNRLKILLLFRKDQLVGVNEVEGNEIDGRGNIIENPYV